MDDNLKMDFNNVIFTYENGKYYLTFTNNETRCVNSIKDKNIKNKIILPIKSEIIFISNCKPSFKEILNCVRDMYYGYDIINLTLKDIKSNAVENYTLETSSLLGEGPARFMTNSSEQKNPNQNIDTQILNKYGKNLIEDDYLKDPSIGRDNEIRRIYQILLYPEKDKSIIITGDAGVGKTALVKGLAYRIKNKEVPEQLKDLQIYSISVSTLVAGTKYVGTLEEKLQSILKEASKDKNILLFIDEIHQAIGAGTSENDNNSIAEILKPYIDYGNVRVIGATTSEEYEKYIASDQAFKTRFKKVEIKEPSEDVLYTILDDLINKYNIISDSKIKEENINIIIKWLISATNKKYRKYNDTSSNPRLVLDIVKEAYAIAALYESDEVTINHICEAYRNEDRLYSSSKEEEIQKLKSAIPTSHVCKIIRFTPKK